MFMTLRSQPFSHQFLDLLEEEMRSAVLRVTMLDGKLTKLPQGERLCLILLVLSICFCRNLFSTLRLIRCREIHFVYLILFPDCTWTLNVSPNKSPARARKVNSDM